MNGISLAAVKSVMDDARIRSGSQFAVATAIALHCDEQFCCHPSIARLARVSRLSVNQTMRVVHALVGAGVIERRSAHGSPNQYRLTVPTLGTVIATDSPHHGYTGQLTVPTMGTVNSTTVPTVGTPEAGFVPQSVPILEKSVPILEKSVHTMGTEPIEPLEPKKKTTRCAAKPRSGVLESKAVIPGDPNAEIEKSRKKPISELSAPATYGESHARLIAAWMDAYEARWGVRYAFTPRDARCVKSILTKTKLDPDGVMAIAVEAWIRSKSGRWPFTRSTTLAGLDAQWNEIAAAIGPGLVSAVSTKRESGIAEEL